MTESEDAKLLLEVAKVAFEAFFNSRTLEIDKRVKVYSSVVDYLKVECKSISIDSNVYNGKNKNALSVCF